jgi:mono/diheme cytochrome c family protein
MIPNTGRVGRTYVVTGILGLAVVALAGLLLFDVGHFTPDAAARRPGTAVPQGDVQRGTYVARMAGCIACHSTPDRGAVGFMTGGTPIKTPFGTFHPPNVTPHPEDGIGGWTYDDFRAALKDGVAPDGNHYYPVFPYDRYTRMHEQDIADLWAAWQTVPPVAGAAPDHDVGFPFNLRVLMAGWKAFYLDDDMEEDEPFASDAVARGAYIVNGPGHCAACHTPRTILGALDEDRSYQGTILEPGDEKVPAITAEALRERGWTERSLAFGLRSGLTPDGDALGGTMGEVVRDSTAWLTDADRAAIAAYLFSLE